VRQASDLYTHGCQRHEQEVFEKLSRRSGTTSEQDKEDRGFARGGWWETRGTAAQSRALSSTARHRAVVARRMHERRSSLNKERYRERNRVERLINRLKQFRCVATRYEKLAANYLTMLTIAAIVLWL
jgi:transposase